MHTSPNMPSNNLRSRSLISFMHPKIQLKSPQHLAWNLIFILLSPRLFLSSHLLDVLRDEAALSLSDRFQFPAAFPVTFLSFYQILGMHLQFDATSSREVLLLLAWAAAVVNCQVSDAHTVAPALHRGLARDSHSGRWHRSATS